MPALLSVAAGVHEDFGLDRFEYVIHQGVAGGNRGIAAKGVFMDVLD